MNNLPPLPEPLTEEELESIEVRNLKRELERRPNKALVMAVGLVAFTVGALASKVVDHFGSNTECAAEIVENPELVEKIKKKESEIKALLFQMVGTPLGEKFSVKLNKETSCLNAIIDVGGEILAVEIDGDVNKDLSGRKTFNIITKTKDPKFFIRSIMRFDEGMRGKGTQALLMMADLKDANSTVINGTKYFERDGQFLDQLETIEAILRAAFKA